MRARITALDDEAVRAAMTVHLERLLADFPSGAVPSARINSFLFGGRPIPLVVQPGIWKPAGLDAALSIRTTYTPPHRPPPYEDDIGPDGLVRYRYRGTDPEHADNRALREAMHRGVPLAYFIGVDRGVYAPRYPVWINGEDVHAHAFSVAVDPDQRHVDFSAIGAPQRGYVLRLTRARLHQPVFRARVLRAYDERCAMCRLHHAELLDAAHIVPDGEPGGEPVVPNGLSLCKIHHAAYDANLLSVRPDLVIEVASRLLSESDGPMLTHGLQAMAGAQLLIPRERHAQPDPERLGLRYAQFRKAS